MNEAEGEQESARPERKTTSLQPRFWARNCGVITDVPGDNASAACRCDYTGEAGEFIQLGSFKKPKTCRRDGKQTGACERKSAGVRPGLQNKDTCDRCDCSSGFSSTSGRSRLPTFLKGPETGHQHRVCVCVCRGVPAVTSGGVYSIMLPQ